MCSCRRHWHRKLVTELKAFPSKTPSFNVSYTGGNRNAWLFGRPREMNWYFQSSSYPDRKQPSFPAAAKNPSLEWIQTVNYLLTTRDGLSELRHINNGSVLKDGGMLLQKQICLPYKEYTKLQMKQCDVTALKICYCHNVQGSGRQCLALSTIC